MSGMHLFTSNKLEVLVDRLAAEMRTHPLPVFEKEVIVVQSKGMQHWLSLEIAERNHITANCSFPFPKAFVYSLFENPVDIPEQDPYSPDTMTWRIMTVLPNLLSKPEFISLGQYCEGSNRELKLFQLSERIATVFDKYLVYRPDLINEWDRGRNPLSARYDDSKWQFILWQALTETDRDSDNLTHAAELYLRYLKADTPQQHTPKRMSLFGISSLPPFYLSILKKLSERSEVFVYYLNPCREFWEYSYSEREIAGFLKDGIEEDHQYYETGNPLLASMGVAGREFFSLILNTLDDTGEQRFIDMEPGSLLQHIQTDILTLKDRGADNQVVIKPTDRSLQIHSCHSPIREIEVLHDNLLSLFEENAALNPKDIVVMMPDVSVYAPLIRAVFDGQESENASIPYSISDISLNTSSVIAETFFSVLALHSKRFKAPDVLDILDTQAVRDRFCFTEDDINRIKTWVIQVGIRWGINGDYKKNLGLPPFQENTWQFGLKRLLLSVALPESDAFNLFAGISPFSEMEGDDPALLGRFTGFIDTLIGIGETLERPKTLEEWSLCLNEIVNDLFAANEQRESELQEIRETLLDNGLLGIYRNSGYQKPVSLEVISSYLKKRVSRDLRSTGFISRGVTFCTLLPMRSIPFKVVYLLGMNDGDFPRSFPQSGFDLCEKTKRLCDRSKRDEDKYLFLESLLSARDHLFISFLGQDITDNSEKPPSVLVSELCDVLEKGFTCEGETSLLDWVIRRHPLQPFSAAYFDPSGKLFSYSLQNLAAARSNQESTNRERQFFSRTLPSIDKSEWSNVSLEQFCRFFMNPCEFLLRNRLNIQPRLSQSQQLEDREPFELDNLQQYRLKEELITCSRQFPGDAAYFEYLKAKGDLAHGTPGEMAYTALKDDTELLVAVVATFSDPISPPPLVRHLNEERSMHLGGVLRHIRNQGQVFYRSAKIKAQDILKTWIHHLMLCRQSDHQAPLTSYVIGLDKALVFSKVEETSARALLDRLLRIFTAGMSNPLPFFPQTSFAFSQSFLLKKEGNTGVARSAAERMWYSGFNTTGEQENEANRLCFGEVLPWSERFQETAIAVFEAVFNYCEEKKLNELL